MANYGHGGNAKEISRLNNIRYEDIIDFSANINPLGMPENVKQDIKNNLNLLEKYPDINYLELKESIAEFENVDIHNIILGNGAADVIYNVIRAIEPKKVLTLAPTFSEYEEAVNSVNGKTVFYTLSEKNDFNVKEEIIECLNEDIDILVICNPNNPTGTLIEKKLMKKITQKAKEYNIFVLVDESFLDFIGPDNCMISYIKEFNNLVIIKSLTKFFAIPGIRIGYGILENQKIIDKVEKISPAWNINTIADIATKGSLKDKAYIKNTIEYVNAEKTYLYKKMQNIEGIKVFKPSVNYIFFKSEFKLDLKLELIKYNILIRDCSNYKGLENGYYRIAVKTHEENKIIIKYLKKIFDIKK